MTEKRKRGRPRKNLTTEQLLQLEEVAFHGGSLSMASRILGVSRDYIATNYRPLFDKKRGDGELELLQMQWRAAKNGSAALLIFLGKALLGQSDGGGGRADDNETAKPAALVAKPIAKKKAPEPA